MLASQADAFRLAFPYPYGCGVDTLDRLVPPDGFVRARVRGDVLCRLAGRAAAT
jgi:hypothetical protein